MSERVGVIDLGSNSARLIIMQIAANQTYHLIYHQKENIRLSKGMYQNQRLQPAAMNRAVAALQTFSHMCALLSVDTLLAVATAAIRNAQNGMELIESIRCKTGIALTIISGEEEARLGSLGVLNTLDIRDALIFDLGGGSTELSLLRNREIQENCSLPFGSITLTEQFGTQDKATPLQLKKMENFILQQLASLPWLKKCSLPLVGIGGTSRTIAKMDQQRKNYPFIKVHNYRLGKTSFLSLWKTLTSTGAVRRKKLSGLSSSRADIIVAGVTLIKCLLKTASGTQIITCGYGLREGLFWRHYLEGQGMPMILPDILLYSTYNTLRFYQANESHAEHVCQLAVTLFDGWNTLHGLGRRDRTLLRVSALLHDIGHTIGYLGHARHGAYLIENARLFGLTRREQVLCAVVVGWHDGYVAAYTQERQFHAFLTAADWKTAQRLGLLLSLAESLDCTEEGIIDHVAATAENGQPTLQLFARQPAPMEQKATGKQSKWFKNVFGAALKILA